jgi:RNA polymerase sigma factor (sigma-70 family)
LKKTNNYTEAELVAALQNHDNDAYQYLYSYYRGALFTVISQFITNREIANDILQEIFVCIWKNIEMYDPEKGKLFTWLHTLARNTTINNMRSKNFKVTRQNEPLADYVHSIELKDPLQQNINLIGLRKHVHLLRKDYKAVIELFYYNSLTQEEVARCLDIPVGTVKTRLRNALIELRKQFA